MGTQVFDTESAIKTMVKLSFKRVGADFENPRKEDFPKLIENLLLHKNRTIAKTPR